MIINSVVLAYHGCDIAIRDGVLRGDLPGLKESDNDYDWLGTGTYFFVGDLKRASVFAAFASEKPELRLTKQPIDVPAVLGAYIELGTRMDLTTLDARGEYREAIENVRVAREAEGHPPLQNIAAFVGDTDLILRHLDRAAFNMVHELRAEKNAPPYDAVVSPFPQGEPVIDGSGFKTLDHVQMALRNHKCIKGWFLPSGEAMLTDAEYQEAKANLAAAVANYRANKPRRRS